MRMPSKLAALEISTCIGCKLNCKYCPQNTLISAYTSKKYKMSIEDFKKALSNVIDGGSITFSGMAETFQNRNTASMIKYAYDLGYRVSLFTTLVDMTKDDLEKIRDVKFSNIVLHIPDENNNAHFDFSDEWLGIFRAFNDVFPIRYYSCHGQVHPQVRSILKRDVYIESMIHNRAGLIKDKELKTYHHVGKITCTGGIQGSVAGFTPIMLPDGTLVACCNDYGLTLVIGNLLEQDYGQIIQSEAYKRLEASFDDDSIKILCRTCNRVSLRNCAIKRGSNLIANHAVKVGRAFDAFENSLRKGIKPILNSSKIELSDYSVKVMKQVIQNKNICIFGLGNLFKENYFKNGWNYVIQANILSDNDESKLKNNFYDGIKFVSPRDLKNYEDLLVIIHVKNDGEIRRQLQSDFGISNIINIFDVYNILD